MSLLDSWSSAWSRSRSWPGRTASGDEPASEASSSTASANDFAERYAGALPSDESVAAAYTEVRWRAASAVLASAPPLPVPPSSEPSAAWRFLARVRASRLISSRMLDVAVARMNSRSTSPMAVSSACDPNMSRR